jgi:hypothetical protein
MFLGHYALALAVKPATKRTSLGVLFAAAQLPDLLWPIFLLTGWEHIAPGSTGFLSIDFVDYPWSHSLAMVALSGVVAAVVYGIATRKWDGALAVALLAVSHWVLDWITHVPDLLLWPGGSTRLGLGLWRSATGTIVVEAAILLIGLVVYSLRTRAADRTGRYAFWSLIVFLVVIYASSTASSPPSNPRVLAWFAMIGWIVPFWAGWADRHRQSALEAAPGHYAVT